MTFGPVGLRMTTIGLSGPQVALSRNAVEFRFNV